MASIESLPPDQRAVLELVLRRGRSYDDIAKLLSIDRAGVRQRALSALDALGPEAGVPAERRALITDYLLGALPSRVTEQVRDRLAQSPGERAWARVIAAELEPIAAQPLPEIPAAGETGPPSSAPPPPASREPAGVGGVPTPPAAPAGEIGAPERPPRPGLRLPRWSRESAPGLGPRPPVEAGRQRPPSRRGGMLVLTAAGLIVLAIVLILVLGGGSSKTPTPAALAPTGTSTPTTSTTPPTSSTPTTSTSPPGQVVAQVNLKPPSGGSAKGIAEVLRAGSKQGLYIVAQGLKPNTSSTSGTSGNAYAVWLYNSATDSHLLGFVNPPVSSNGKLQTEGQLPSNASHYGKLLVTLETQGSPKKPGTVVLEGPLSGL